MKRILHGRAAIAWWIFGRGLIGLLALVVLAAALLALVEHLRGRQALRSIQAEMQAKGEDLAFPSMISPLSEGDRAALKKMVFAWNRKERDWPFQWGGFFGFPRDKTRQAASLSDPLPASSLAWKDKARRADPVAWLDVDAALAPLRPSLDIFRLEALSLCLNGGRLAYSYSGYLAGPLHAQTLSDLHAGKLDTLPDAVLLSLGLKEGDAPLLTWEALQHDGWTDDGLVRLAAAWSGRAPLDEIGNSLRLLRAEMDHAGWRLAWQDSDDWRLAFLARVADFAFHDLVRARSLASIQSSLDALQRIRDGEPYPSVAAAIEARRAKEASSRNPLVRLERKLTGDPFGGPTWLWSVPRRQAAFDEVRVAIALARYRLQNGRYPATLALLAPQFLPAVPKNLYDGKPLSYHLWDDGTFLLEAPIPKAAGPGPADSPVWPRRVP